MRSQSLVFHVSFFIVILAKKWPHVGAMGVTAWNESFSGIVPEDDASSLRFHVAPFGALFVGYNMRPFGAGLLLALSGIKSVTCGSCYARMKACVG